MYVFVFQYTALLRSVHMTYGMISCGEQVLVTAFTVVPSRSGAVRTFEQRTVLEQFNPRCVAVSLSGYIFFGGSVKISDKVMEVRPCTDRHCPAVSSIFMKCNWLCRSAQ